MNVRQHLFHGPNGSYLFQDAHVAAFPSGVLAKKHGHVWVKGDLLVAN